MNARTNDDDRAKLHEELIALRSQVEELNSELIQRKADAVRHAERNSQYVNTLLRRMDEMRLMLNQTPPEEANAEIPRQDVA